MNRIPFFVSSLRLFNMQGQRPSIWMGWDEVRGVLLKWSGYKILAVDRTF